jgi:hypothetical protein
VHDFVCFECGIWCSSQTCFDQHVAGWAHSKRIAWLDGGAMAAADQYGGDGDSFDDSYSDGEASWGEEDYNGCSCADCTMPPGHMLCKLCDISCGREGMWSHLHVGRQTRAVHPCMTCSSCAATCHLPSL